MSHNHNHEHQVHHHHDVNGQNLIITIFLNIIITVSQLIGGIISGSVSLMSDAMHNLSDVISLVIAYFANKISTNPITDKKTFGYKRIEILATLVNASILFFMGIYLIIESINKFFNPEEIESLWVIYLGLLSIVLNYISVILIKDDSHGNLNIKAAYIHLLSDVMTSFAIVTGGLLMYFFDLYWIDPIVSIVIALYLIYMSIDLLKESLSILMHFVPNHINIKDIENEILNIKNIKNIHHLHVWRLNDRRIQLETHLELFEDLKVSQTDIIISEVEKIMKEKYEITHITLQFELNRCSLKELIKK